MNDYKKSIFIDKIMATIIRNIDEYIYYYK